MNRDWRPSRRQTSTRNLSLCKKKNNTWSKMICSSAVVDKTTCLCFSPRKGHGEKCGMSALVLTASTKQFLHHVANWKRRARDVIEGSTMPWDGHTNKESYSRSGTAKAPTVFLHIMGHFHKHTDTQLLCHFLHAYPHSLHQPVSQRGREKIGQMTKPRVHRVHMERDNSVVKEHRSTARSLLRRSQSTWSKARGAHVFW